MSKFTDPEQEAKKDTRRAWKFMIAALVLVFGLFAGLMLFYDCPPLDDSSIMPQFTESPGGHNPLAVFLEELKVASLQADFDHVSLDSLSVGKGTNDEIKVFLTKQTVTLQAFEKLTQTDLATWRWPDREKRESICDRGENPSLLIYNTIRWKVNLEKLVGKKDAALNDAIQLIKFSRGLEGAEGSSSDSIYAYACAFVGRELLEEMIVSGHPTSAQLAQVQQQLAELEPRKEDLIMTIKVKALALKNFIALVKKDPSQYYAMGHVDSLGIFFLKPQLTYATSFYYTKPVIDGFNKSWEAGWSAASKMNFEFNDFSATQSHFWLSPNASGNSLLIQDTSGPQMSDYVNGVNNLTASRLTVLMLAMRRYELDKGKLPETLDALVPQYLAAVPIDPFNDAAMRWNPSKNVIYSIGENGKDDDGNYDHRNYAGPSTCGDSPDVGMLYWWSEEAKAMREGK